MTGMCTSDWCYKLSLPCGPYYSGPECVKAACTVSACVPLYSLTLSVYRGSCRALNGPSHLPSSADVMQGFSGTVAWDIAEERASTIADVRPTCPPPLFPLPHTKV